VADRDVVVRVDFASPKSRTFTPDFATMILPRLQIALNDALGVASASAARDLGGKKDGRL